MRSLDDPGVLELDRSGMLGHATALGRELIRAWKSAAKLPLPAGAREADGLVIAGMGGSATAGDYLVAVASSTSERPVVVVRGFSLPNWVGARTLVVVASHSGNTEEALACYDDAWKRDAMIVSVTGGGALAARAVEDGTPVHRVTYDAKPRAALGHALGLILRIGARAEFCAVDDAEVRDAGEKHAAFASGDLAPTSPASRNGAKQLAVSIAGRIPFVLADGPLWAAGTRFANQLAENGKTLAAAAALPEAAHNLVVGLETGALHAGHAVLATLESPTSGPAARHRLDAVAGLFGEAGIPVHRFEPGGETLLTQLLQATAWADFVSIYLGLVQGIDPTPIPQIDRLKAALG